MGLPGESPRIYDISGNANRGGLAVERFTHVLASSCMDRAILRTTEPSQRMQQRALLSWNPVWHAAENSGGPGRAVRGNIPVVAGPRLLYLAPTVQFDRLLKLSRPLGRHRQASGRRHDGIREKRSLLHNVQAGRKTQIDSSCFDAAISIPWTTLRRVRWGTSLQSRWSKSPLHAADVLRRWEPVTSQPRCVGQQWWLALVWCSFSRQ
jgi:hypothetical protein